MDILNKTYIVTMPNGSKWGVPVWVIAYHRVDYYRSRGDEVKEALQETKELFEDRYEIHDWAANNMDWSDVESEAGLIEDAQPVDKQEGWVNGDYEVR